MEFIEGDTLRHRISRGPVEWKEATRLTLEIAEALAQAHDKGVIHRDLKPANIMLGPNGHVKVMDFGVAKRLSLGEGAATLDGLTRTGVIMGTLAYMSPEQ